MSQMGVNHDQGGRARRSCMSASPRKRTSADPHAATLGGGRSTPAFQITTARRCSFVNGQLSAVYAIRAQRTYSVRSLTENPLERPRTKLKFAPGFLIRSAPEPRRVVDRVGA